MKARIAKWTAGLGTAALALFGCGGDAAPEPPSAEVVDSAGVSIVTSRVNDRIHAALADEPSVSIGALEGPPELLFDRIGTVARDESGNIVVADAGAGEIRVFDPEGVHLRSFGGRGEGPGEFAALAGAWPFAGGVVVAVDRRLRRISRFDAGGALIGTADLTGFDGLARLNPIGPGGSATVLVRARPSAPAPPGGPAELTARSFEEMFTADAATPEIFVRHRLDGTLADTLAQRPSGLMSASASGSGAGLRIEIMQVPFSPRPSGTGSARGAAVTGGTVYEVAVFSDEGALETIARLAETPDALTDEHLEAHARNAGGQSERDDADVRRIVARYREMPLPPSLPAYADLRIAETGEVWAQRFRMRGAAVVHWDVFSADGVHLGRVEVPSSFRIEEVGRGEAVGVSTDDLGVERVEIREITLARLP